jgi:hypothetical protein
MVALGNGGILHDNILSSSSGQTTFLTATLHAAGITADNAALLVSTGGPVPAHIFGGKLVHASLSSLRHVIAKGSTVVASLLVLAMRSGKGVRLRLPCCLRDAACMFHCTYAHDSWDCLCRRFSTSRGQLFFFSRALRRLRCIHSTADLHFLSSPFLLSFLFLPYIYLRNEKCTVDKENERGMVECMMPRIRAATDHV